MQNSGNSIVNSETITITLSDSESISSINSTFDYVVCDSDSSLYLKNYMNIDVSRLDSSLKNVDVRVKDGNNTFYFSVFQVVIQRLLPPGPSNDILVIYRVYDGSSSGTDNETSVGKYW